MKQITIRKKCKIANCKGEMTYTGQGISQGWNNLMDHRCNICGDRDDYVNQTYPHSYIEFEPEEKETRWI